MHEPTSMIEVKAALTSRFPARPWKIEVHNRQKVAMVRSKDGWVEGVGKTWTEALNALETQLQD